MCEEAELFCKGILCCADGTIEPAVRNATGKIDAIVGGGVQHRCRSTEGLYAFSKDSDDLV